VKKVKSLFACYLQHRAEGCAPKAATELTAALFGKEDAQEVLDLQVTLEGLEERDRPTGVGPIEQPNGIAQTYLRERRAGESHEEARRLAGHAYGHRGESLDEAVSRPARAFERELEAARPITDSPSVAA
jgi:hypothetical protein